MYIDTKYILQIYFASVAKITFLDQYFALCHYLSYEFVLTVPALLRVSPLVIA